MLDLILVAYVAFVCGLHRAALCCLPPYPPFLFPDLAEILSRRPRSRKEHHLSAILDPSQVWVARLARVGGQVHNNFVFSYSQNRV